MKNYLYNYCIIMHLRNMSKWQLNLVNETYKNYCYKNGPIIYYEVCEKVSLIYLIKHIELVDIEMFSLSIKLIYF